MQNFSTITYETEGPLAWISLNRPEKLNVISKPMVVEINAALDLALQDEQVRVILVKGEGRAFSAGFDLEMDPDSALVARWKSRWPATSQSPPPAAVSENPK
jgi:enoyl-CoA hydratase/carnithine racemase